MFYVIEFDDGEIMVRYGEDSDDIQTLATEASNGRKFTISECKPNEEE